MSVRSFLWELVMCKTVKDYFRLQFPDRPEFITHIDKDGEFWKSVRENTISEADVQHILDTHRKLNNHSAIRYQVAVAIQNARRKGSLPSPEIDTK